MEHYVFNQKLASSILMASGWSPSQASAMVSEFAHFCKHHGPEWAVSRIKNLKAVYLQSIGGQTIDTSKLGIRFHEDGTPKGAFRPVFRLKGSEHDITKALNALMMYTGVVLPELTLTQWEKFHKSVVGEPSFTLKYPQISVEKEVNWSFRENWKRSQFTPLDVWIRGKKSAPIIDPNKGLVTRNEGEIPRYQHLLSCVDSTYGRHLIRRHPMSYQETSDIVAGDVTIPKSESPASSPIMVQPLVGTLGFIQERGAKCRVIANPFRVHQAALSKLGNALFEFLRTSCPWDCTHDQSRGLRRIQEWMGEGKTIHSVDLSDATNNFPLDVQMDTLASLTANEGLSQDEQSLFHEQLSLFRSISRGTWSVPKSSLPGIVGEVRWLKGQPLGLYPSFAAFAVTHGLLLRSLERSLGLEGTFVVLGDDVAISNDAVHVMYRDALKDMGCPVSELKSISSRKVAEFAGRIVFNGSVLRVEKWKGFTSDDPLAVIRQFGEGALKYIVPPSKVKVLRCFAALPEPVGCGLNAEGIPLGKRMEGYEDLYWPRGVPLSVPGERLPDKVADAEYAFDQFTNIGRSTAIEAVALWQSNEMIPNRESLINLMHKDRAVVQWAEHVNAVVSMSRLYDISPTIADLRSFLAPMCPIERRGLWDVKPQEYRLSFIERMYQRVQDLII